MKNILIIFFVSFAAQFVFAQTTTRDSLLMAHVESGDTVPVHNVAEEMPAPQYDFNQYLQRNMKYPKDARDSGWQGVAYVHFVVEENGSISHAKIIKSSGHNSLDAEALVTVAMMPAWQPGKISGKPVRVEVVQPVRFSLSQSDSRQK